MGRRRLETPMEMHILDAVEATGEYESGKTGEDVCFRDEEGVA